MIILVVGLIWGLGIGFAIASAGTFLGEMACFIAFKYYFIERAKKVEEESLLYGALARLMREGGLGMLVLVRFSVLPGELSFSLSLSPSCLNRETDTLPLLLSLLRSRCQCHSIDSRNQHLLLWNRRRFISSETVRYSLLGSHLWSNFYRYNRFSFS